MCLSGCSIALQRRNLAIVVQTSSRQADIERLASSLSMWRDPDRAVCSDAVIAPGSILPTRAWRVADGCGPSNDPLTLRRARDPEQGWGDLLFYVGEPAAANATVDRLLLLLGSARRCFSQSRVISAQLTRRQTMSWPRGPNAMFVQLLNYMAGPQGYAYFMLMESDLIPIRPNWLRVVRALIPPTAESFWLKGSHYRGPELPFQVPVHINGNAIVAGSQSFLAWMDSRLAIATVGQSKTKAVEESTGLDKAYDVFLGEAMAEVGLNPSEAEAVSHRFVASSFVISHYSAISLDSARARFPCSLLLHANFTKDWQSFTRKQRDLQKSLDLLLPPSAKRPKHAKQVAANAVVKSPKAAQMPKKSKDEPKKSKAEEAQEPKKLKATQERKRPNAAQPKEPKRPKAAQEPFERKQIEPEMKHGGANAGVSKRESGRARSTLMALLGFVEK